MTFLRDDRSLLTEFRAGKPEALEIVYRAYVRSVERYIRGLARSHASREFGQPSAVADFLQEVFVRAFSPAARQAYDGIREYGAYLTVIARNCFIDAQRRRGREVLKSSEDLSVCIDSANDDQEDGLDPRVQAALSTYLSGLSDELKLAYDCRFVRGLSQEAACAQTGLSRRTLRTAEAHLRNGLRKALRRAGLSVGQLAESETNPKHMYNARLVSPRTES